MKIKKFRVQNYKSIIDSGDCYPTDSVTILAGKNESGKSSLLEALEDFNLGSSIREKAVPIEDNRVPKISVTFLVPRSVLESIFSNLEISGGPINNLEEICVSKTAPADYQIEGELISRLGLDQVPNFQGQIDSAYEKFMEHGMDVLSQSIGHPIPKLSEGNYQADLSAFESYESNLRHVIEQFPPESREMMGALTSSMVSILKYAVVGSESGANRLFSELSKLLPNFILFSSFDDVFPNEIPLSELSTNKWIKDLELISDIDVDVIGGSNARAKVSHKTELNLNLNKDFSQFWTQDASSLKIEWDNQNLQFWIYEEGKHYEPEIRSQGRRWHLAFYVRVSARAKDSTRNVILIDEPGLYLHANAQRDILKNLENASKKTQIIFSTHSPYLIEWEKLDRVRLVQKSDAHGSVVENKVHSVSDKETLTPILTAIGLELNQGIVAADKRKNVVVEGPSDYFYLTGFKILRDDEEINFVSGGSSGNMPKIGTILQGWGCDVVYLYDNDQAYKDALKHIRKEWMTISTDLVSKIPVDGAIEDILSKDDFLKYVLFNDGGTLIVKNSEYFRGKDKVLPARKFLSSCRSENPPILSEESKDNIRKLFELLEGRLSAACS